MATGSRCPEAPRTSSASLRYFTEDPGLDRFYLFVEKEAHRQGIPLLRTSDGPRPVLLM